MHELFGGAVVECSLNDWRVENSRYGTFAVKLSAGGTIMGANIANTNGYDGSTQISAVADTGLGGGTGSTGNSNDPGAGR